MVKMLTVEKISKNKNREQSVKSNYEHNEAGWRIVFQNNFCK